MSTLLQKTPLELIEDTLKSLLPPSQGSYELVFEAARYSLFSSGKRIRPLLTLAAAEAFFAPPEKALIPACCLELIHTYSLIHDDLPCMDDDDLRRGKPTLHKVYPEGQAVLAGDLLLTYAFEVLSKSPFLTADQMLDMVRILAERSGGNGMIGGQSLDLLSEGKEISWDTLKAIHLGKTAALLSAALEIGGVIADVSPTLRVKLKILGETIGLSFQIIDDVLDIEGKADLIGKPLMSDVENKKNTSVSLLGLESAKKLAEDLLADALDQCEEMGIGKSNLAKMLPKLVRRLF
jgi:geranylgeranyl diphosphate synthase type II